MKFGPASPAEAIGGVTVHTLRQGPLVLKKGTTIGAAEVEALAKAGVRSVFVESPGTAHEWQTWRNALHDFAPRLFWD